MKKIIHLYLLFITTLSYSQIKDTLPNFDDEYFLLKDGDSLVIQLNEVTLLPKHKFKNRGDINYYYWLRKKRLRLIRMQK